VDQINLWGFYSVGGNVRPIGNLTASTRASDALSILAQADLALRFIDDNDKDLIELERSLPLARELRDLIKEFTEAVVPRESSETPPEYVVGAYYADKFGDKLKSFEAVLRSELAYVHAYGVSDKGILSTTKLIQSAELAIPEASREHLSTLALSDIQSAGRCLAFDLPTACGFHAIRALEAVTVDYILRKTGQKPTKRDLGAYIDTLKSSGADEDVTSTLDQLRRIRRNPLMHPEDTLDEDTAIRLFQLCVSAITACISDMQKQNLFDRITLLEPQKP
jgi:hypothetical protein